MTEPPFARLEPATILDALESAGLACDGRLLALNSYENRVWQAGCDDGGTVVAKFYRPGRWTDAQILEEHAFVAEMAAAELPVVPPMRIAGATLHRHDGFRFAVYPRQGGRAPEFADPAVLPWLGRFLARIHNVGARRPFSERETLDAETYGEMPLTWLDDSGRVPDDVAEAYFGVAMQALDGVADCEARAGRVATLRLHGDCHAGNVLWTPVDAGVQGGRQGGGPHFVDFDDARQGPAVQDLWMLLSGTPAEMAVQLERVLEGYEMFRPFDRSELHLVEALRTLRLLHHSAWLARRWDDPAFPAAFPWFATPRYWEARILELREQIAAMAESALASR